MISITVKLDESLAKEMNESMNPYYSTKTEFVREAIRDKVKELKTEEAVRLLRKYKGSAKTKTTDEEDRKIREEVSKEFAKKFGIDLD